MLAVRAFPIPALVLAIVLFGACATDVRQWQLPQSIQGAKIEYQRWAGPSLEDNFVAVPILIEDLDTELQAITLYTASLEAGGYTSDFWSVTGVRGRLILDSLRRAYGFSGEERVDVVEGKRVVRARMDPDVPFDEAPYFYSFGNTAVIIQGTPAQAADALRQLP